MSNTNKMAAAALIAMLGTAFTATTASAHGEHMNSSPKNPYHGVSRTGYCIHKDYWHKDGLKQCDGRGYHDRDHDGRDDRTGQRYDNNGRRY